MYAVIVFALVLLSPMPFVSPFGHIVQDVAAQSPFGPFEPTTSPSLIIEPNAQEFGLKSDLAHSSAGYFNVSSAARVIISVIDDHTYAIMESGANAQIRNITNITSPTIVSTISSFGASRLDSIVIDDSTYLLGLRNGDLDIANISNVKNPNSLSSPNLGSSIYEYAVETVLINNSAYALLGYYNGGILILNITSPNNVNIVHNIEDHLRNTNSEYTKLHEVHAVAAITIEESVYALATNGKYSDDGEYGLTIIDITNPSSPFLVSNETLGIGRSFFIDTVTVDESIYVITSTATTETIHIINITDPYSPEVASTIVNGAGYTKLSDLHTITTATFGTSTFALVTDQSVSDGGIQIIDISNPYAPSPASAINDGQNGYTHLSRASGIATATLDGQTYALAASRELEGIQIIKLDYSTLISLTSNNTNPAYAKAGDNLKLEFSATRAINDTKSAEILGIPASSNFSGENFEARRAVPSSLEIERYANFMAIVNDSAGNLLTVTDSDLLSNIFVDTKRPQISLIGDADLEVFPLTEESSIPGATAIDGDPNYAGNYTITTTGNLSTTPLGSTVIFTYTAADDGAGNAGHSTTRTVTVGQPNIIHFTSLNIASSSGDNFARATQSITVSIVTDGSELGNFTGTILGKQFTSTPNGGSASFTIEATPDDPYGNATFSITLTNASGNNITITNVHITDGSYITVDTVSPTITLHGPDDVTIFTGSAAYVDPGATAYDASYGNKTISGTGTVDTLTSGTYPREYKAPDDDAGNTGQIVIRTVTVMPKPFEFIRSLGVYEGPSLNHTTVNDATFNGVQAMASIQINDSTYVMAATNRYTDAGINIPAVHIFDITDIDSPRLVNKTVFYNNNGTPFLIDHITISTIDDNTYAIASAVQHSTSSTSGVLIINISNPESPSLVTYVTNDQNFAGLYDPRRIAVTTIGEFTYALVPSSDPHGVVIMNITNPENPTLVIAIKDKESGGDYDILQGVEDIAIINTDGLVYALVTADDNDNDNDNDTDNGIQIINITDISNPIPVSSIVDNRINSSSPYTALDSPRGIDTISIGESIYALVASYIDDGVQIINITNPENPSSASAYAGNGLIQGAYDVSTITIGESIYALSTAYDVDAIVLFDITNPAHPQFVHRLNDYSSSTVDRYHDLDIPEYITMVTLNTSTYALVSSLSGGIQVINLASPDVSVFSNNTNNASYAKTGDSLNITLFATDIISSGSATILGLDADVSHIGENFTASVIVPSTIQEEYANFTVTLENNYGDTITFARNNSVYSNQFLDNVFVDNIAPRISLDGSDPYYLVQNRSINTIPTVTVTDGDPDYPEDLEDRYTITTSNDLNTSKIGSTAIFTYTAEPDGVGNPGPSVTRNVTIVGYTQIDVTSLTVSSDNSVNSSYAKAGDNITITIETDGIIETITGNILGGGNYMKNISSSLSTSTLTLTKTITQSDTNGNLTFNIFATNSSNYAARATHEDLTTSNIIIDTISPTITLNGTNNTVSVLDRTYTDANATAYDLSYGSKNVPPTGTVDINNEGNYTLTYSAPPDFAGNEGQNITRNVRVLDLPPISFASGLGVSSAGSFDIPTNAAPNHVSTFKIDTATYAGFRTVEGVFIMNITDIRSSSYVSTVFNTSLTVPSSPGVSYVTFVVIDGFTYALSTYFNSMLITDVTNPATPSYVAHVKDDEGGFTELLGATSITTTTIDSSTYALVVSNFDHGVQIINITNPYEPIAASNITDDSGGYTTLRGATSITTTTIDSSTYALVASSSDNGVQIIDITNPYQPTNVSAIIDGTGNFTRLALAASITTITIDSSTYALVASEGDDGVQIINITNPYEPIAASSVKDGSGGYTRLDGAVYVTTEIINSRIYALVAAKNDDSIQFIDITNPYNPTKGPTASDGVDGYTQLNGVVSIATVTIDSLPYAITSSLNDKGIQIINLNYLLTFNSSNTNPAYAKAGDTLTLEFAVNDTIVSSTTQFTNLNQIPSVNITNATSIATYHATLTVPSDPIEEYVDFVITLENNQSVTLSVTENDFPSNIFVDTIAPTIELDGNQDHTVYVGTQNLNIPGATASDGSPGYSANYTVLNGSLNTSVIGSTTTYTYTADSDAAGNPGESITRTVTVIDYTPINVTELTVSSSNQNNSYARAGDVITILLRTDGSDVGNATGIILGDENFTPDFFGSTMRIQKTIKQNDTNGDFTFEIFATNSSGYAIQVTPENLTNDNIIIDTVPPIIYLYGTNDTISGLGLPYVDAGAISHDLSYGTKDVLGTGTVTTSTTGSYYITYSATDFAGHSTSITRTVQVQQLGPISLTSEASQFLVSPTSVVDYTDYPSLTDPYRVTTTSIGGTTYALIVGYTSHSFTILDISTPTSPTLVFNATGNTKINADLNGPTGISIIQIQNSPHAVISSLNTNKIAILDITNPTLPVVKSIIHNATYPDITAPIAVSTIDVDGSVYALVASKSKSLIAIFNITEPNNPTQVTVLQDGENYTLGGLTHITPIKMDDSTYILTSPRSNNSIGIIDIGNPKMPKQVALIKDNATLALQGINSIETASINGRTYALVASPGESAMQIIDVTHPILPFHVSTARSGAEYPALINPHDVTAIKVEDSTYALLSAVNDDVIQIIDITNPQSPRPASNITLGTEYTHLERPQTLDAVQIDGDAYALIAGRDSDGIQIIKLEHEKTTQSPFSITSSGANSSYAKAGDTISVQIAINDTIYSHTAQILNLATHTIVDPNTINASAVISPTNVEEYANFTIFLANYLGVTLNLTQTNLTTQNVFVDTIAPTITLNGDADYTVFVGSTYVEPGVVALDGDPNYVQTYTTINNSLTFDTSIIGSNVTYTYTADSDGAGNLGANITRNVTVVDYNPLNITSLSVSSSNSNSSYAKAGDQVNITIVTDGSDITSITGPILGDESFANYTSGGTVILSKTITQNDTNGNLTFVIFVTNSSGYAARATHEDLIVDNIIIDTIRPTVTLNGANNTISVLDRSYIDAGATAYDLSYGSKSVQSTDTVTTNIQGNNTLRYTAPDDYAGNLGLSITRNVIVADLPPIEIEILSITSTNTNNFYAKAGDNLTVRLAVNDTIVKHDVEILNTSPTVTNSSSELNATISIQNNTVIENNATFSISIENIQTITLYATHDNLTAQNVFVDTIAPTITLNGNENHTILVNSTYVEPGVVASDGDPNYAQTYTTINNSLALNTSIIGSNVIYTYTADPDTAGNLGANITRNVTVVDYIPLNITSLSVSSSNSNSSYAKAGDQVNITIVTDGSDITNAAGPILGNESFANHTFGGTITLSKTITQNDTNGNLTFDIFVTNSSGYAEKLTHENLIGDNIIIDTVSPIIHLYGVNDTISGLGFPYVDAGAISYDLSYGIQDVLGTGTVNTGTIDTYYITYSATDFAGNLVNIIRTVNVQQLEPISLTNEASQFLVSPTSIVDYTDYPSLTDPYRVTTTSIGGTTYALIVAYASDGFTILNISTPDSPTLVFNATGNTRINADLDGPLGISITQIQNSPHAVITSALNSTMAIIDITNPTLPVVKSIINNTAYPDISAPFAVSTIDVDGSVYALVASKAKSLIAIFNITEPNNPTQVTVLQDGEDYTLGGLTHITPIHMDNSTYILTSPRSNDSIGIIDIGNPKMPKQVALIKDNDTLALQGINSIETASINGRTYALVAAAGESAMQIIDVTHPAFPFPVSTARSGEEYPALLSPHDVTVIKVEDSTYALLSAITHDVIQIIDITNPQSPRPASNITDGTEYTHLEKPQTLDAVQIDGDAYALIVGRDSDGIQIIKLEHEKTTQSPFSITSNGANSSYAKAGDTISVQIAINDTIYSHTAQILNLATHTAFEPNTINASAVISPVNVEGYANFTISLANYLGVTLNLTQTNLTTQNVFVDTIAPTITLNGDADYTVFVNSTYVEPGVVASDGDPNYVQTYTTINNSLTLNTSIIGSNVTYTYTADPDGAGNLGESITRNVTVVDYNPLGITSLSVSSNNSDSSYAKAGDQVNITIVTDGSDIANATGYILGDDSFTKHTSGGTITLSKIITQSDANGNLLFGIFVINSTDYAARITQDDLTGSNIIIDTIPPTITLNGANNTVVEFGSAYTDPGANAVDSSYEQTQIIYSATVVNTSIIDAYSLIYTPPNDPAGNVGQSIKRIVTVSDSTPAILDSLTATSNNNNPAYAKAGDNITITLNANQDISSSDIFIQNTTITGTIQSNILSANYTVQDGQNGNLTFEITAHFDSSLPFTVNASDLASSIFIDTEKPTITLTGPTSLTVPINQNYTDYMTNVTDNDPSYNETVSSNISEVNTSNAGSYTVVYSANADTAGNIPDNKTRIITVSGFVLDISSDNTGSNTVAKTGDNITIQIISDQYIGATITSATILGRAADAGGITGNTVSVNTTVLDSDSEGNVEFSITLTPASGPSATLTHSDLTSANVVIDMTAPLPTSAITITPYLITVVFNEGIKTSQFASGVVSSNIGSITTLSIKDGPSIPSSILDLEVSLTTPLPSGAVPIIQLGDFGLSAISDIAGNEFAPTVVQASDGIPPSLHSATVVSSALIEVYFDEPVQLVPHASTINPPPRIDGKFATSNAISGDTLSIFSPSGAFQTDAILNISFTTSSIIDLAGNTFASGYVLTSESDSLQPYTINSTTIIVPYTAALDLNSLSTSDYRVSFDSNPPSGIRSVEIFNDTIVIITMQVSFGTGAIPFVEQPGTVTDILGNTITMQSAIARDRASPLLVIPILSTSTNTIAVEFSESITSPSNNIANYDLSSTDGRSAIFGLTGAIITTSPFLDATFEISAPISIQDLTGNIANGTDQRVVINR